MSYRIGQFLLYVGLIVLIIFFASDYARQPQLGFLCSGVVLLYLAGVLIIRNRKPPEPSQRFRLLRGRRGKDKKAKPS